MNITIKTLTTEPEIAEFWAKKAEYNHRDLYPNMELEAEETLEEIMDYFEGEEYREAIMTMHRERGGQFAFFYLENAYLGFALYKVYTPAYDKNYLGEAMLMEFCIEPAFRNLGLGALAFQALEHRFQKESGTYTAINTSNQDNLRFWKRQGFSEWKQDEWGNTVYRKDI